MTDNDLIQPSDPRQLQHVIRPRADADGAAIAAIITVWFLPLLGVILGHVSRGAAKRHGLEPASVATAAMIIGYIGLALGVLLGIMVVLAFAHTGGQPVPCDTTSPAWPYC
jgi:hypothetical protein